MDKKIPIQNRALALILSLLFSLTLITSTFALPVELVMFNHQSYKPILEKDDNLFRYSEVISQVLVSEFIKDSASKPLPKIFSNNEGLRTSFKKNISPERSLFVFNELSNQTLNYLNFQTPNLSLNLDIGQLKTEMILKSEQIASDYLSTLSRCTAIIEENFSEKINVSDIDQLPPCKPSGNLIKSFQNLTAIYIEDFINRLPENASLTGALPIDRTKVDQYFYFYSIGRWVLRVLPIFAIILLIVIASLLQDEKKVMLKWVGRLLVFTSGLGLIGLVIILIGFDQFIVLLLNRHLNNFIEGFGIFLLGLVQEAGYMTLIWVIISFGSVFAFGVILLMVNRFISRKTEPSQASSYEDESKSEEVTSSDLNNDLVAAQKEIMPETLEEIEAKEKKNSKKKNINNNSL